MIDIKNLNFGYSRKRLLYKDFNLSMASGSVCGLLGKNGAGKSTLLKTVTGTLFPASGTILINGCIPGKRKPSFLETVYFLPEEISVPRLSVKRYLSLFSGFYPCFDENLFFKSLDMLEVSTDRALNTLSFGQQKKFMIAFGIACNTRVLLMDEPTNGMDIPSKTQFRRLVSSVFSGERMLIISTHQVRDLDSLIDRVVIVDNGRLLLNMSVSDITRRLYFTTLSEMPDEPAGILYAEPSLRGISVVMDNEDGEDSKINLEHLFNAVIENPQAFAHA